MKVLFQCDVPASLAHGGAQVQVEQTLTALRRQGVEAEPLRWWDTSQRADIIHCLGRPRAEQIRLAHGKGIRYVFGDLLGRTGARSPLALLLQQAVIRALCRLLPKPVTSRNGWESYRLADAVIALTAWEARLMQRLFRAPPERLHILPNGVEDVFLKGEVVPRGEWLVTTASILPVKRVVETARAAVRAGTPYWVVGKPFAADDPYYRAFLALRQAHPGLIRYEGPVASRPEVARIYRQARGFVLLSRWESLSLSALEAAACGCPLLLSNLPWARSVFGSAASYCARPDSLPALAGALADFHRKAPGLPAPPRPLSWDEVAARLKALYGALVRPAGGARA